MDVMAQLRDRFAPALAKLTDDPAPLLDMIRRSQDPKFGDYQANFAMPLAKSLGKPPRDVAAEILAQVDVTGICDEPKIEGPGFINLRLSEAWMTQQLERARHSERLGVESTASPQTVVVDYSAPNVAKEMHVGHIRSTVIGDSIYRILKFLGHRAISDNHIGDWGTQFGMIIYGYRHFVDPEAYERNRVTELARLYRLVNRLVSYHETKGALPQLEKQLADRRAGLEQFLAAATGKKPDAKQQRKLEGAVTDAETKLAEARASISAIDNDPQLGALAKQHAEIGRDVLKETAKLHANDEENRRLWREFLPACLADIDRIYQRLGVRFDLTLGESFYHDRLARVVMELEAKGLARDSHGAKCVFLPGHETPMIVQKQDGAFLYATTDLATIQYRVEELHADAAVYVVDHRQGLHFQQLFEAAKEWGYGRMQLTHVSFGTVLGDDGKPFKTRSGDTVGLSGLLDEAVLRAGKIVEENDRNKPNGPELSETERQRIAEVIGIAALKYADLSQNRTSDYVFSYDKMLAMTGNTATYMQYAYARVRSIFTRGQIDADALRSSDAKLELVHPAERALGLELLRCENALQETLVDFRPNQLTSYLFDLANRYSTFFEECPVLKAPDEATRDSRLLLCDLTARTIKQGLALLGIEVVERM
jgi:arginyl-tRNA synthetase